MMSTQSLQAGWATASITPDEPVYLSGQFHARVSEGVRDPVTVTVLALTGADAAGSPTQLILVSCDLVVITDELRDQVRQRVAGLEAGIDPAAIVLNATHTHTGPETRTPTPGAANVSRTVPFDLQAMDVGRYVAFAVQRIAGAVVAAWRGRAAASVGWGLSHAVIGHNRRWCKTDGTSRMYGDTNDPDFSHIEGYEDHGVGVLATWDAAGELTGLGVNIVCPSQETENEFQVSADFWHDTRQALAKRLGRAVPVLAQCSAAGDQSPHHIVNKTAEARMRELRGLDSRSEIARRLSEAVAGVLPLLRQAAEDAPVLCRRQETVMLPRRLLTEAEVETALEEAAELEATFERMQAELEADPAIKQEPRWYVRPSAAYRRARWSAAVKERFELQKSEPELPVEVNVVRLGDLAFATNPFEYYLDFGMHIKARSPAIQTMVVQLAGPGSYLAPRRSLTGGSYGAQPASTIVGPEGGELLARRTVELLKGLWPEQAGA